MKKLSALIIVCMFALTSLAIAAPAGEEGASDQALKNASDQAVFNRIPDWFATVGKSAEEKDKILADKKALRAQKHADKEAKKAEKQARKEARKAEKEADRAMNKAKGDAEKTMNKAKGDADEAGKGMKKGFGGFKEKMKLGK
jgi:hypothetical protein